MIKNADSAFKVKPFDKRACEEAAGKSCRAKYDATSTKVETAQICPTCMDMTARTDVADNASGFVEQHQGQIYCAGTVPLP